MIDIRNLVTLLPPYYRENDTYKDSNGEGILERFLKVMGDYLKDDVSTTIDGYMDKVVDPDTMDISLINLVWEYLGSIPYAYGMLMGYDVFGNPLSIPDSTDTKLRARYRDMIKYAISLYKIRGTLDFYPLLLNIYYGYDAIVRDPTGDFINPQSQVVSGDYIPKFDEAIFDDGFNYDLSNLGNSCVNVSIVVSVPLADENNIVLQSRVYALLNKYRPVHILPFGPSNVSFRNFGFPYLLPIKFKTT